MGLRRPERAKAPAPFIAGGASPRVADPVALNVGVVLAILTLGLSVMLLFVSLLSWSRLRNAKLLVAGGAFLVLALQGALWTWRGVVEREMDLASVALDFAVLGFLYASVATR